MRRLILAFDMGLGKTIIGCVWAKAFQKVFPGLRVFVIAPVTLHEDWRRTATEATGLNVESSNKKKTKAKPKKERKKKKDSGKTVTVSCVILLSYVVRYCSTDSSLTQTYERENERGGSG